MSSNEVLVRTARQEAARYARSLRLACLEHRGPSRDSRLQDSEGDRRSPKPDRAQRGRSKSLAVAPPFPYLAPVHPLSRRPAGSTPKGAPAPANHSPAHNHHARGSRALASYATHHWFAAGPTPDRDLYEHSSLPEQTVFDRHQFCSWPQTKPATSSRHRDSAPAQLQSP